MIGGTIRLLIHQDGNAKSLVQELEIKVGLLSDEEKKSYTLTRECDYCSRPFTRCKRGHLQLPERYHEYVPTTDGGSVRVTFIFCGKFCLDKWIKEEG